jgi:hypothetical protein
MRKVLFIALICIITSNFLYAQKGYGGGLNFAYHSTWIFNQNAYGDPALDYVNTYHPAFGLHGFYNASDNLGVWLELNIVTLGQKYEDVSKLVTRNVELNYLAIPIMAKYTSGGERARFHFMLGPEFSILTSANQEYKKGLGNFIGVKTKDLENKTFVTAAEDISDRYITMDFMLAFDIGADISINDYLIVNAGLRGNYGFRDINAEAVRFKSAAGVYTASNNGYFGLQVGVSYFFSQK